jgi:chemotaxis protein CheX
MKVGFINPFVDGAVAILEREVGLTFQRGGLDARRVPHTTREVTIVLGVGGDFLNGIVMYSMDRATALEVAARMIGEPCVDFDALAQSAVAELGNMITGLAATRLAEAGFPSMITPPALVLGASCTISILDVLRLVVPLDSSIGTIEIQVGLTARD